MNKKAFTTVEMILTILLVVVIMATITSVTLVYRDKSEYEESVTEIENYKNTLTKIIYDDILYKDSFVLNCILYSLFFSNFLFHQYKESIFSI